MPSLHPSETPPLGWLVPCLAVADLEASLGFYARLGFVPYGGNPAERWSMVRNRAVEIHLFQGHIPKDLLNFRGCDPAVLRAALQARGLEPSSVAGPGSFTYLDPDGREVFFDTGPEETAAYLNGQPLTGPIRGLDVHEGTALDVGNLTWCLACEDLGRTTAFYEQLGLVSCGGEPEQGWAVLGRVDHLPSPGKRLIGPYLSLFVDMIPTDTLNFRGGNVGDVARALQAAGADLGDGVRVGEDGGESLLLLDPDERPVFFDTAPAERL